MIFTPRHARAILRGTKTETRRRIRPDETECRYQPGQAHAIQPGRGLTAVGRLTITDVHAERLGDLTAAAARAEGYDGRDPVTAFIRAWIRTHEPAWRQALDDDLVEPHELRDRWDTHHAPHAVWVVRFELDTTAQPRLLAHAILERLAAELTPRQLDAYLLREISGYTFHAKDPLGGPRP